MKKINLHTNFVTCLSFSIRYGYLDLNDIAVSISITLSTFIVAGTSFSDLSF